MHAGSYLYYKILYYTWSCARPVVDLTKKNKNKNRLHISYCNNLSAFYTHRDLGAGSRAEPPHHFCALPPQSNTMILFLFSIFKMKKLFSIVSPPTFHLALQSLTHLIFCNDIDIGRECLFKVRTALKVGVGGGGVIRRGKLIGRSQGIKSNHYGM